MDRTADCLKKRVRYNFEVYTTNKCRWWSETPVFYIYVDDELWFASNPNYYGLMDVHHIMRFIHEYLNVLSVKECLDGDNYILKMLAVLDRRAGKRTIKRLIDNISDEPDWFRKYIILRAENEGINIAGT